MSPLIHLFFSRFAAAVASHTCPIKGEDVSLTLGGALGGVGL